MCDVPMRDSHLDRQHRSGMLSFSLQTLLDVAQAEVKQIDVEGSVSVFRDGQGDSCVSALDRLACSCVAQSRRDRMMCLA